MAPLNASAVDPLSDPYNLWNAKLLENFFSRACEGDEVWLQLDNDELDLIGPELGGDEGFLRAVQTGPAWQTFVKHGRLTRGDSTDLMQRVQGLVKQRLFPAARPPSGYVDPGVLSLEYLGYKAPTYLPFLAALVRSSALASSEGYYKHLQEALRLQTNWGSSQLAGLEAAWEDLEVWTRETKGRFGRFVVRRIGGHAHVGVPRAQCIMSRRDCEESSRVFKLAGLRPGQEWSPRVASDVISCASEELSASFRDAVRHNELAGPIEASLRSLFEEWDGRIPPTVHRGTDENVPGTTASGQVEVALCPDDGAAGWHIHWRVPPLREGCDVVLEKQDVRWRAPVWGTERCGTLADTASDAVAGSYSALVESADQDVDFKALLEEEGSDPVDIGTFVLPRADLRVFVWGIDYYSQREELQEHPLPQFGCAYLLATKRIAHELLRWLERGRAVHEIVEANGLPPGWILACITDCSTLTYAQRDALPGAVNDNYAQRMITISGGRSVSRASKRQYLSYDLPTIELDAPPGTALQANGGLDLKESSLPGRRPGVRRFTVSLRAASQKSFRISAVHDGRELASATLRVAPDSGEQVTLGKDFSLDPMGNPQAALSGLHGTLGNEAGGAAREPITPLVIPMGTFGNPLHALAILKVESNPATLFLDSLAQHGAMAFGMAKDQLTRLLASSGHSADPVKILLDLRCRGHVEIETNAKGHFSRVHAVTPALYQLPMIAGGMTVYGILGSLLKQQWRSLFEHVGPDSIYERGPAGGVLPTWRILARDVADIGRVAHANGMALLPPQSRQIASWAATSDEVRHQIEHGAVESVGTLEYHPMRLNPVTARFVQASSLLPTSTCQLFRMDDRDMPGGRVYVLAIKQGNTTRYGFVRDSRWGMWISLRSFALLLKETFFIDDACPWPIPYSSKDRTLMVPAHISLPVVLERALVLCSGQAPDIVATTSHMVEGQCVVGRESDGKSIAVVSRVYNDMADRKWLLYRAVPIEVATIVANKLGASLANS